MAWKKKVIRSLPYSQLVGIGKFKLADDEPIDGKNDKLLITLVTDDGKKHKLSTYESSISQMLAAEDESQDGYIEAYLDKKTGAIRFTSADDGS